MTSKTPASDNRIRRADNLSLATTSTIHRCTPYSVLVLLSILFVKFLPDIILLCGMVAVNKLLGRNLRIGFLRLTVGTSGIDQCLSTSISLPDGQTTFAS